MNPELYEQILNEEAFMNDLWMRLGSTDKLAILEKHYDLETVFHRYVQQEIVVNDQDDNSHE